MHAHMHMSTHKYINIVHLHTYITIPSSRAALEGDAACSIMPPERVA